MKRYKIKRVDLKYGCRVLGLGILMVLLFFTESCSDDFGTQIVPAVQESGNVTLLIPSVQGVAEATRTRTGEEPNRVWEQEGTIKNMYLYAYPVDGGTPTRRSLSSPVEKTDEYAKYKLSLSPGDYHIYIVGNFDEYVDPEKFTATISEDELKALTMNYNGSLLPNLTSGLPMVATPDDFAENVGGKINVPYYKGTTLTADLRFLCAKVRLTLFFDSSSESAFSNAGFGEKRPVLSPDLKLENLADATIVDSSVSPTHGYFSGFGTLTRKTYPEGIETESDIQHFDGLDDMDDMEDSDPDDRMAWQTILYLPENLTSNASEATVLNIEGHLDGNDRNYKYRIALPGLLENMDNTTARPLNRGKFHDLTACMKTQAGVFDVHVRTEEWTVKNLAHNLHGPFRLEVEKTEKIPVTAGEETHLWYSSDVPVTLISQQEKVNGELMNVLIVEKMENHENDSLVIRANPALPVNFDLSESYFHIVAGNLKKKIQIWPFVVKAFFNVTPQYTSVEVREKIEEGSNTASIPIRFTTNLEKVTVRVTDGWEEGIPVSFRLGGPVSSQDGGEIVYEGDLANEGFNIVDMTDFIKGNPYWSEGHTLKIEYRAFDEDGNQFGDVQTSEIEIIPKKYAYRIYFRPQNDDWISPHVYIYESLALPRTLDVSKIQGSYKDRAGRPVGGFVYRSPGGVSEAGLKYSFSGKVSFLGWSTQGGPVANDPYEDVMFPPSSCEGFYVFGEYQPSSGYNSDKKGYGMKYIPPASRTEWNRSGPDEATIRQHYDIDTDYMSAHRSRLTQLCPLCCDESQYNMKFPGIRMLMSEKYPGWWYVDLTEIAAPGRTLIMFHDGHTIQGGLVVPGGNLPGVPLFDYSDHEGWLLFSNSQSGFTDDRPAVAGTYSQDVYRICWPKELERGLKLTLLSNNGSIQADFLQTNGSETYHSYDEDFNYVEFRVPVGLRGRQLKMTLFKANTAENSLTVALSDFIVDNGVRYYTFTGNEKNHPGVPDGTEIDKTVYRIYWKQNPNVLGINLWFRNVFKNNYHDKTYYDFDPESEYVTGTEILTIGTVSGTFNYYQFRPLDPCSDSDGWQMHYKKNGAVQIYSLGMLLSENCFMLKEPGVKAVYRDENLTMFLGHTVSGDDFRIYWPKIYSGTDIKYAWFWGVNGKPGDWIEPIGSEIRDGIEYYFYDFTDSGLGTNGSCGIIPKSNNSWTEGGVQPSLHDILFRRESFIEDAASGKNIMVLRFKNNMGGWVL